MNATELISRIETHAPLRFQASWDKSGVQVAGEADAGDRLAVCLDPVPAQIRSALDRGARFILCHHPLALTPRLPDRRDDYHEVLRLVLSAGAWLYAAHTSLDVQLSGPPGWLAEALGLRALSPLEPLPESTEAAPLGYGLVGDLPAPLPYADCLARLADLLDRDFFLTAGPAPALVRRLAYCPGSGASLAGRAFAAGADVFVTGDVKYHQAMDAAAQGHLADAGHFALEEAMTRRLAERLAAELTPRGLETIFLPSREPFALRRPERPRPPSDPARNSSHPRPA